MAVARVSGQVAAFSALLVASSFYRICVAFHPTYRIGRGVNIQSIQRASIQQDPPSIAPSESKSSGDEFRQSISIDSLYSNGEAASSVACVAEPLAISNDTAEIKLISTSEADLVLTPDDSFTFSSQVLDENTTDGEVELEMPPCIVYEREVETHDQNFVNNSPSSLDSQSTTDHSFSPALESPQDVTIIEIAKKPLSSPGLRKIFKLAIPAIGVWLCGPILSLIDTASVGLLAGTVHQAALSPAVAVTEYSALLMAFLYTGTTNQVAASQENDGNDKTKPRTARTLISSLQLSFWVGASLGGILLAASRPLLKLLIGNEAVDPMVFETALKYVRIRALGMPAGTVIGSAQAACMGMQDVKSPLYVLAAAAFVNLMGDLLLVGHRHPWLGGAAGAAWATVFSQFAALAFFMKWLLSRSATAAKEKSEPIEAANNILRVNLFKSDAMKSFTSSIKGRMPKPTMRTLKLSSLSSKVVEPSTISPERVVHEDETKKTSKSLTSSALKPFQKMLKSAATKRREKQKKSATEDEDSFSTRGFLHGRFSPQHLARLPSKDVAKEFLPYVLPITTTSLGRVSAYVAMAHVISSVLDTGSMAAQQVIISIFYCLTPIADSLNLTAQSLLPAIFQRPKGQERANVLRETTKQMMQAGAMFGGVLLTLVCMIPLICNWFTSDASVILKINGVIPFLALSFVVHGLICSMEGCMLGQKDLGFLGKSYAAYFVGVPYFMLRAKSAALSGDPSIGLHSVWRIFMYYQLVRVSMFLGRVWKLGRKATVEASGNSLLVNSEGQALATADPMELAKQNVNSAVVEPVL